MMLAGPNFFLCARGPTPGTATSRVALGGG